MNRIFIAAALLLAGVASLQAKIIVDCRGIPYTNLTARVAAGEFKNIDGIVVTPPFKTFPNSTLIYDYRDTGNSFQQGRLTLRDGTLDQLKELQNICKKNAIRLMSQVKLFNQAPGYNLSFWHSEDFLPDEAIYRDNFLVDISRASDRIGDAVRNMQRAPIDVWIVDMTSVPYALVSEYDRAVRRSFSANRFYILAATNYTSQNLVSPVYYWKLRQDNFLMPLACFTNISAPDNKTAYHYVASSEMSINNISTALYMLSIRLNVILPERFFHNDNIATIIAFLNEGADFKTHIVNDKIMILYSQNKIVSFNLGDDISMSVTPPFVASAGSYRSMIGASFIESDGAKNYFFLLPRSVYVWSVR